MNRLFVILSLALAVSMAAAQEWVGEYPPRNLPTPPTYVCYQVATPPVLDGVLNDACWQGLPEMHLHRMVSGNGPTQPTIVKAVWHGDYIYFAWRISESDLEDHNSKRDNDVYMEQCVEHFLQAPGGFPPYPGGPNRYCEVDPSPTGVIWDGRIWNPYTCPPPLDYKPQLKGIYDNSWSPDDVKVATVTNGTVNNPKDKDWGWTLEAQIPLNGPPGAKPPHVGDVWRMNLYRIHNRLQPDAEFQSWSVVGTVNQHTPARFGYLRFAGPLEAKG